MRSLVILFFAGTFAGCGTRHKDDRLFESVGQSFQVSENQYRSGIREIIAATEDQANKSISREKAALIFPLLQRLDSLCRKAADRLPFKEASSERKINGGSVQAIFDHLQSEIRSLHPVLQHYQLDFRNGRLTTNDSISVDRSYVDSLHGSERRLALSQLRHNIFLVGFQAGRLLFEQTAILTHGYVVFAAIVGQNSNMLRPGEWLYINAGIGSFSFSVKPLISVNGHRVEVEGDGQAHTRLKVPERPGMYQVPVVLEMVDQDGKRQTVTKNVEYRVVDCPSGSTHF